MQHTATRKGSLDKFENTWTKYKDLIDTIHWAKTFITLDKNEGSRVLTTLYIHFFKRSRTANSVVGDGIWQKFKLVQAFMIVFVTCQNEFFQVPFNKKVGKN